MVGRDRELDALTGVFGRAASANTVQLVTVAGEPGIGKTRLAEEFCRWVVARGGDVLHGRAVEVHGSLPYAPVVQALRDRLERENAPDDLLADVWLGELGRILPELLDRYPDLPRQSGDGVGANNLFEAVARLVHAFAEKAPVVLLIDDAHWADAASLDLLLYGARRWAALHSPVLLLLTARDTEPFGWLASLERDVPIERIAIGPLGVEDTLRWVSGGSGSVDLERDAFGRWLFGETHGQPFFVSETLKMLVQRGVLVEDDRLGFDYEAAVRRETELRGVLPPSVREVVRARLSTLGSAARGLLAAAAVLGHGAEFGVLWRVADLDESNALAALDALLVARLLRDEPARAGARYTFSHDKIRETVYVEASDARRQVLHRRAFEVLENLGSATAAELASHAVAAGMDAPAFSHSLAAGGAALDVFAVGDAILHLERARTLVSTVTPEIEQLERLFSHLGRAHELAGALASARTVYEELLNLARGRRLDGLACLALNRLATVAAQTDQDAAAALSLLREAQLAARTPIDVAETEWNLAQVYYYARDLSAAEEHARQALAVARELDQPALLARALNVTAYIVLDLGDLEAAIRCASEARQLYAQLGNRALEVDCLCQLTGALTSSGQHALGLEHGRQARAIALEIGNTWAVVFSAYHLGLALLDSGALDEAGKLLDEAAAQAPGHVHPLLLSLCRNAVGVVARTRGDLETALAIHLGNFTAPDGVPFVSAADVCADLALLGRWTEAAEYARGVAQNAGIVPAYGRGHTLWLEVEAPLRACEPDLARETLAAYERVAGASPRYRITILRARAALAAHAQDSARAASYLDQALELATELRLPLTQAELR
jgi:predicted ATPase